MLAYLVSPVEFQDQVVAKMLTCDSCEHLQQIMAQALKSLIPNRGLCTWKKTWFYSFLSDFM